MKNLSLKQKILALAVFMSFVSIAIGGVSFYSSHQTVSDFNRVVSEDVPGLRELNRMLLAYRMARVELLHLMTPGTPEEFDARSLKNVEEQWKLFDVEIKNLQARADSAEEKLMFEEFSHDAGLVREDFTKALELYHKNPSDDSPERKAMTKVVIVDLVSHGDKFRDSTKKYIDFQAKTIDEDTADAAHSSRMGNYTNIAVTLLGSLLGLIFAFLFSSQISTQINRIVAAISESSLQVASASSQIAGTSQELSQATSEQAASLEETAASLEEISTMISKASESASVTGNKSAESQRKAEEGRAAMDQMMSSMDEISQSNAAIMHQVNTSNSQMAEIVRVIQEIGEKTKVINDIVFQTKLLSFNASVEAARAGEQGKGFAVVAEEVGNLAAMSGNAAKDISDMLDNSIQKVQAIAAETKSKVEVLVDQGKHKVESGVQVARQCSGVLDEIVQNVTRVSGLAQEISQAAKEQSQGVGEINKAMGQLDSVTQQNSATSQQAASAAEQLSAQADTLKGAVSELVFAIQGGGASAGAARFARTPVATDFAEDEAA